MVVISSTAGMGCMSCATGGAWWLVAAGHGTLLPGDSRSEVSKHGGTFFPAPGMTWR
jgi:hypothetical protein